MSTSTKLGSTVLVEGQPHLVVRIVWSDTLFETETECYILHEHYAELRAPDGTISFTAPFTVYKTEFVKDSQIKQKGLDPTIWRRF